MNYYKTFQMANEMGIDREEAANLRIKFLQNILFELQDSLDETCNQITTKYVTNKVDKLQKEINYLNKYKVVNCDEREITQDMIYKANEYPIEELVNFNSFNRAIAFCHNDNIPSLSKHPTKNYCRCFTCSKNFDPIGILMERDGLSFVDAVRKLQ